MKIPAAEFEQRCERLRARMQQRGLDTVLLATGMNLKYFTAYPSPAFNVVRPFFAVLPLHAEPCFITHTAHVFEARRYSWITDIRTYEQLSKCPVTLIANALRERGTKRIGLELGLEQTCGLSPLEFEGWREMLREWECEDIAGDLWALRAIKSDAEIECLRGACRITSHAYSRSLSAVRPGALESEIYGLMREAMTRPETGELFLVITSGEGNYDLVTKMPEDRAILPGDMVWMDAGCSVSGYWSDFSRAAIAGKPSEEQKSAQAAICCLTRRTVEMIRPGVSAASLAAFALNGIEELPFPITSNIAALAGRVGHGVGLNLTEPPHLSLNDNTLLQPGMVVSVEPGVATSYGTFHVEENVLVTSDGYEVLSGFTRDLSQS